MDPLSTENVRDHVHVMPTFAGNRDESSLHHRTYNPLRVKLTSDDVSAYHRVVSAINEWLWNGSTVPPCKEDMRRFLYVWGGEEPDPDWLSHVHKKITIDRDPDILDK